MELFNLFGILIALAVIVYGVVKGFSLIIVSVVATFIVILTGRMDIAETFGQTYTQGMANFVVTLFPLFLSGILLGKLLEVTELSKSIARSVLKRLGEKNVVLAMCVAVYLMTVTGISVYVIIFTVYPLATALFNQTKINRNLLPAIILGSVASAQMLPGTPIAANIIPAEFLGVTPMAAPITAIIGAIVVTVLNTWYLIWQSNKSIARGETFRILEGEQTEVDLDTSKLPNALLAIIPFAAVIVLLNVFNWPAWASLFAGSAVLAVMFFGKLKTNLKSALNDASKSSMTVIQTAAIVGFGSVVAAAPGYTYISNFLTTTSFGNPYLYAAIAVSIIASVTGSATGSMRLILNASGEKLLAMGANPQSLSRVFTMSSFGWDSLPHSSAIVLTLNLCNVTHKEGYWHLFVTTVLTNTIAMVIGIILATVGVN